MILLDTAFLYAFFQVHDPHHNEALTLARRYQEEEAKIPIEILEELITLVTYKNSSAEAIQIGNYLLSEQSAAELLPQQESTFQETWKQFQQLSPHRFSYVDCLLISLAKAYQCPVLTFDKKLQKALHH